MKDILIYFNLFISLTIIAIFIYKFQNNPIDQICPCTVYFKIAFNQPEDRIIYDFSAYKKLGIVQIIEGSQDSIIDYCMKYCDEDRIRRIEALCEVYDNDSEEFIAAIEERFSGILQPLVYTNQQVIKYKDGAIKWIIS